MVALKQPTPQETQASELATEKEASPISLSSIDTEMDVPATVVCASCGDPGCIGCRDVLSLSGIVSVVPWERPGGFWNRFWTTARAASFEGESFFERLPDGPLDAAIAFALMAEIIAISSFAVLWSTVAALVVPDALLIDLGASRLGLALRYGPLSVLAIVVTLLGAHSLHALGLALGAGREGRPLRLSRALRFGFYSCAWDVVLSPFGLVVAYATERGQGLGRMRAAITGLPTRCSIGLLRGVYRLDGPEAKRALNVSYVAAVIATLLAAGGLVTGALFVIFR